MNGGGAPTRPAPLYAAPLPVPAPGLIWGPAAPIPPHAGPAAGSLKPALLPKLHLGFGQFLRQSFDVPLLVTQRAAQFDVYLLKCLQLTYRVADRSHKLAVIHVL